jgi:hypothetical protein
MRTSTLLIALFCFDAAYAAPPGCQELADKVTKKFEAVKKMSGIDGAAKCSAISLVILDLQDLAKQCAIDENFRNEVYMPLAKAIGAEAPNACKR